MQGRSVSSSDIETMLGILLNPKFAKANLEVAQWGPKYEICKQDWLANLPMELILDILLRLDLRDLLRVKFVSKSLSSLIGCPEFADVHLRQSLESGSNNSLIVYRDIVSCHSMKLDELERSNLVSKVHHRLARGVAIVGSCNGLLCIRSDEKSILLYNPSTKERYQIPATPMGMSMPQANGDHLKFGFGYDSSCSDYYVLQINSASSTGSMLYSLKNNKWINIDNLPSDVNELESDHGVLCNKALHWIAKVKDGSDTALRVIAFDLHEKNYHLVPFPSKVLRSSSFYLGNLDGCLCTSFFVGASRFGSFQIHVMKEYGMKDSWTLLFKITANLKSFTRMRPITYSRSGDEVLLDINNTHFLWFDLQQKKIHGYVPCSHYEAVFSLQTVRSLKSHDLDSGHLTLSM